MIKTIKVDERTWQEFKSLAARQNVDMADMLKVMVQEYQKQTANAWQDILDRKPVLNKQEANVLEQVLHELREDYGWRI